MYHVISFILCFVLLVICSVFDIKKKMIPIAPIIIAAISACVLMLLKDGGERIDSLIGMGLGVCAVTFSKISKQAFGMGDGLILLAVGALTGFQFGFSAFFIGLVLSMIASVICMLQKKLKGKDTIPFVPFLLAGFMIMLFIRLNFLRRVL